MHIKTKSRMGEPQKLLLAALVTLSGCSLYGCYIAREFGVSTSPNLSPVKRLKSRAVHDSVDVEYWVSCWDSAFRWNGDLHVSIRNRTSDTLVYDWSETTMQIQGVFVMKPGDTYYTSKEWDAPPLSVADIPPGKESEFVHYYSGSDLLVEFSQSPYLTYLPGVIRTKAGESVSDSLTIYATPKYPSIWQAYHSVGGPVRATVMDPATELDQYQSYFEEQYSVSSIPDSAGAAEWIGDTCFSDSVIVMIRARGWDDPDYWSVALDVEIKNNLRRAIVFRWDSASVAHSAGTRFRLAGARVGKKVVRDSVVVPGKKKMRASLYYADTLYLPEFIRTPYFIYQPGEISAGTDSKYRLTQVYAFALYDRTNLNWVREKHGIPY